MVPSEHIPADFTGSLTPISVAAYSIPANISSQEWHYAASEINLESPLSIVRAEDDILNSDNDIASDLRETCGA